MFTRKDFDRMALEYGVSSKWLEEKYLDLLHESIFEEDSLLKELIHSLLYCDGEGGSTENVELGCIYDLSTEEEIESRYKYDQFVLNEGCSPLEDFEGLEKEALEYFRKPKSYPIQEDDEEWITGYIGIFSHTALNDLSRPIDVFQSTGDCIQLRLESVTDIDAIQRELSSIGYQYNDLIQIKFYGASLVSLVGSRSYDRGESLSLVELPDCPSNILFAVPNNAYTEEESSYFILNKIVQEEILYGRSASEVLGAGFVHWSLCREFLEVRLPEIEEESREQASLLKIIALADKKKQFKDNFSEEVDTISKINSGELSVNALLGKSQHEINRLLWVCKSKDFSLRIESRAAYMQITALSRKLGMVKLSNNCVNNKDDAVRLVEFINIGGDISRVDIDDKLLESVFALLWDKKSNVRIKPEYKDIYFHLKNMRSFRMVG